MSEEITVIGGAGGTRARLDDLTRASTLLENAARHLEGVGWAVRVASGIVAGLDVPVDRIREKDRAASRLAWIDQGRGGSTSTAFALEEIAQNLRETVNLLEEAENAAASGWGWVGRLVPKARAILTTALWVPAKAVGAGVGALCDGIESVTPAWHPTHWLAGGTGAVADLVNPDWTPDLTPLLYGDDLQTGLHMLDQFYQGHTALSRLVPFAGRHVPDDLVEALSLTLASVSLILDELLGDLRDVLVFPVTAQKTQAPEGMSEVLGRLTGLAPGEEDGPSRIAIERIEHPDGTRAWIVEIPGTQDWIPDGGTNPFDSTSNYSLMAVGQSDLTRAVDLAMSSMGIRPGEDVLLVGHSQGGIAAMELASEESFTAKFAVSAVLTAGAPVGRTDPKPGVHVLSLEHPSDTVPALDATANPDRPDWTTARRNLAASDNPADRIADRNLLDRHILETYLRTAQVIEASPDPSIRKWIEETEQFWTSDGKTSTRVVFEATRSTTGLTIPSDLPVRVLSPS